MENKKTLVIGASENPARYSNMAIAKLLSHHHSVVAIGQKEGTVMSVKIETHKEFIPDVHTITLYLNPERQKEYYEYIVSLNPHRVIFNPGTENPEFYDLLRAHSIEVEVACTLVLLSINQY